MKNFVVRGRSIDGVVYALRDGWTSDGEEATFFTEQEAEARIAERKELNKQVDVDNIIGHLTKVEI